jgi:hypothetical protein
MASIGNHIAAAALIALMSAWDGGALRADGPPSASPITVKEAEPLVRQWAFWETPALNPATHFKVEETKVDGLWDALKVQLFRARYLVNGQEFREASLTYHNGDLHEFVVTFGGRGLMSGTMLNGAFYYSYSWGSGVHRSHIGKLSLVNGQLMRSETGGFRDRDLFVKNSDGQIKAEVGFFHTYNSWQSTEVLGSVGEQTGKLEIVGGKLEIVGGDGKPMVPDLGGASSEVLGKGHEPTIRPYVTLTGTDSRVQQNSYHRIQSEKEWIHIWQRYKGEKESSDYNIFYNPLGVPVVDFQQCMVIAICQGQLANTAGLTPVEILEEKDRILFRFVHKSYQTQETDAKEVAPGVTEFPNVKLVNVYGFFVVPRSTKTVVIEQDVHRIKGRPPQWKQLATLPP